MTSADGGDTLVQDAESIEDDNNDRDVNDPDQANTSVLFCASCDRCRSRKTKCDGRRPCQNCTVRYLKKNKLSSIEGIDTSLFDCTYRPAKRRGPVPGKASQVRKVCTEQSHDKFTRKSTEDVPMPTIDGVKGDVVKDPIQQQIEMLQQNLQNQSLLQQQQQLIALGNNSTFLGAVFGNGAFGMMQQQLIYLQQQQQQLLMKQLMLDAQQKSLDVVPFHSAPLAVAPTILELPKGVMKNIGLLDQSNSVGSRLRSSYNLIINQLFSLPPVPSDDEYVIHASIPDKTIPGYDQSVLRAARFAEIALGALVNDQVLLALELSNATITCLRQHLHTSYPNQFCVFQMAKAYFLHGMFRSFRGDMSRYLKYRRVCLNLISRMVKDASGMHTLIAAISFQDALAYMVNNANEEDLPDIDDIIPPVPPDTTRQGDKDHVDMIFNTSTELGDIASHPDNQTWMQGAPAVFINKEAPLLSRCLDAIACAVRSCCDQANVKVNEIGGASYNDGDQISLKAFSPKTPTSVAVYAYNDELCSRNLVASGYALLKDHATSTGGALNNFGHQLIFLIMSAFLEVGDEQEPGGLSESQIKCLFQACRIVIENPSFLYQGGPTYHMVSNAAIMLCYLLNALYVDIKLPSNNSRLDDKESRLFEMALDTFISLRNLLETHRSKMPQILRCHKIPRINFRRLISGCTTDVRPLIDLGETLMCHCRGCQVYVLMGCSPCVAAERARDIESQSSSNVIKEQSMDADTNDGLLNEFDKELKEIGTEFDLDDDTLLTILGKIMSS